MPNYQQGDIVTIPYPYDDFSRSKVRPAIIIGNSRSRVGAFIITKITTALINDIHSFRLNNADLTVPTVRPREVRCNELLTASESVFIRKVTELNKISLEVLCEKVKMNFDVLP
jgi:mRNA interferase MazF